MATFMGPPESNLPHFGSFSGVSGPDLAHFGSFGGGVYDLAHFVHFLGSPDLIWPILALFQEFPGPFWVTGHDLSRFGYLYGSP